MRIISKKTGGEYERLIKDIEAPVWLFDEYDEQLKSPEMPALYIRHDVDHDLEHALAFARAEASYGIKSTYFLLHTAGYFDYSQQFLDRCKELIDLGHRVGLHNNIITEWLVTGREPAAIAAKPLSFFWKNGIIMSGSSSHGDPMCYRANYINYEIWQECPWPSKHQLSVKQIRMQELLLNYEAYFLHRDYYLSDSGGRWRADMSVHDQRFMSADDQRFTVEQDGRGAIDPYLVISVYNSKPGVMQVLAHPVWWEVV